jgi:hypothetical protein
MASRNAGSSQTNLRHRCKVGHLHEDPLQRVRGVEPSRPRGGNRAHGVEPTSGAHQTLPVETEESCDAVYEQVTEVPASCIDRCILVAAQHQVPGVASAVEGQRHHGRKPVGSHSESGADLCAAPADCRSGAGRTRADPAHRQPPGGSRWSRKVPVERLTRSPPASRTVASAYATWRAMRTTSPRTL